MARVILACLPAVLLGLGENTVYIVRHGEKKWFLGCLSDQGQSRAQNLVSVFDGKPSAQHETFGTPKAIFANWYDDPVDCERCLETVTPVSQALNLSVDHTHGGGNPGTGPNGGNPGAAAAIKAALREMGGPVLVGWESANIHYLAEALGVENAPKWHNNPLPFIGEDDYDSVWVIRFDEDQAVTSFNISSQNFHPSATVQV